MGKIEVLRAEEEWQRAGAYSVRIEGMNRQHHISLREEFDEHDKDGTKYIVLLDDGYPVATCRFYELDENMYMVEMAPKADWIGKSLSELNLRSKLNLNVVAERGTDGLWQFVSPRKHITPDTVLLIVVEKNNIRTLQ